VKTSLLRFLPFTALVLAASFIAWDLGLMSRAAHVQHRLDQHVRLLDGLGRIQSSVDKLAETHRTDLRDGRRDWNKALADTRGTVDRELGKAGPEFGLAELRTGLHRELAACDSLHWETAQSRDAGHRAMADAVFGLLAQRARKHVDASAQAVQRDGLGAETMALSDQWSEAQWLLVLASLFALVCAFLVGGAVRLVNRSHERSELLARTGEALERSNRELRETMLSKEEKEVMLKEIHHRVKNNLQIVRSLIRFQTDKVDDPRTLELFNECVNRVGAMALVHEQTYLSKDLANIDVGTYLNSLIRDLVGAYNIRVRLKMDVDIRVKTLGVDTLTPLGLLINEVVSNSFKHAFTGREEGTIIVHLSGTEEGGLFLRVGDDGVGLPDHGRWKKPSSLGMELIHTLAGQLNATMNLLPGPGMVYELHAEPELEVRRRA
jgi:two-component sensor histidine kinase